MRRNEKVTKIMTAGPAVVQVGQPLSEVSKLMHAGNYHHVPVVDGTTLVGILSSTDLLRVSYEFGTDPRQTNAMLDHTVTVRELMNQDPIVVKDDQTVREATEILSSGAFHSLPVVDESRALVGLVTTTDVLRYMLEQY